MKRIIRNLLWVLVSISGASAVFKKEYLLGILAVLLMIFFILDEIYVTIKAAHGIKEKNT